jgi:hypothetical protein
MPTIRTWRRPIGLGRSGDRVAKTPVTPTAVATRMHRQYFRLMQPGEDDHLVADPQPRDRRH